MDTSHTPVHLVIFDLSAFRNQLWAFYGRCGTWRAVADLGDFEALRAVSKAPPALLCKLAKETDYYPTDLEICKALNIPAPVLVLACPICGDPHTHTHDELPYTPATHAVIPLPAASPINGSVPTQSKPDTRNYERISIRKDDPARAARSIVDNIPPATVRELIENLITITNG